MSIRNDKYGAFLQFIKAKLSLKEWRVFNVKETMTFFEIQKDAWDVLRRENLVIKESETSRGKGCRYKITEKFLVLTAERLLEMARNVRPMPEDVSTNKEMMEVMGLSDDQKAILKMIRDEFRKL